jgi:hypothetical protein
VYNNSTVDRLKKQLFLSEPKIWSSSNVTIQFNVEDKKAFNGKFAVHRLAQQ